MEASPIRAEQSRARRSSSGIADNGRRPVGLAHAPGLGIGTAGDKACRALSIVAASLMLVVTAPLMLIIGVAIKLNSPGPILFMQPRVGINRRNGGNPAASCNRKVDHGGRPFRIFKFRTMYVSPTGPNAVWAEPGDPRVTPVGRVLRKFRLDELPQLFNVLRGDMDLVGPRPEQPKIFADLRREIEHYDQRQLVRPGITGWAQVNQPYDSSIEDVRRKVALDLEYIERKSVIEDLRILLKTVPVVIFRQGAW